MTETSGAPGRRGVAASILGVAVFLAFLPALAVLPYHGSPPADAASAAVLSGYDNSLAFLATAAVCAVGVAAFAAAQRRGLFGDAAAPAPSPSGETPRLRPLELAAVGVGAFLVHCPWFLARHGPYREDSYFLSVLHRMDAGQRPYVDFESLYGPLMLHLPHAWCRVAGFSMTSYLALVALMEVALHVLVLAVVQRHVPGRAARLATYAVMAVFLVDVLLGVSSNGLRRMLPVFVLVLVAHRPRDRGGVVAAGVLVGVCAAYSHEFGALALASVLAVHGLEWIRRPTVAGLAPPAATGLLAGAVWAACSWAVLGAEFGTYVRHAVFGAARFAQEASFAFFWTANSLATFALVAVAVAVVGRGLGRSRATPLEAGDRLLFGGFVYAVLALKSGLNRADMWHVATPMLALLPAFLFPLPRAVFVVTPGTARLARGLVVAMAATYAVGLLPPASYVLAGLANGARDVLSGRDPPPVPATRAPAIEGERTEPIAAFVDLGGWLADPARRDRPVVPYSGLWYLDKRSGFVKVTYPTDDFLLDDAMGEGVRRYLEEHPEALLLMRADVRRRLEAAERGEVLPVARVMKPTVTKTIATWVATTEFVEAEVEQVQKEARWERTVGRWAIGRYRVVAEFGDVLVLERN